MANQAATPTTASRSRASTAVREISDRGTPAPNHSQLTMAPLISTPEASVNESECGNGTRSSQDGNIATFKPYQALMETEITFQYGKNLRKSRVLHQEMLCCHSDAARDLFEKAKPLRDMYTKADNLRKTLKSLVYSHTLRNAPDEGAMRNQAVSAITTAYATYPLHGYLKNNKHIINEAINDQITQRNVTAPHAQTKLNTLQKEFKDAPLPTRLEALNVDGILAVARCLLERLRNIKSLEKEAAKKNEEKAAAQGRYILPGVEDRVVMSLVQWIYCQGELCCETPEHLYLLHNLAVKLGMNALAEQCLGTLSNQAKSDIEDAISQGLSLQQVLCSPTGIGEHKNSRIETAQSYAQVVFRHVLADLTPPERLILLVTDTLSEHLDSSLWDILEPTMNENISRRLIKAMIEHREVKYEELDQLRVKHENVIMEHEPVRRALDGKTEPK